MAEFASNGKANAALTTGIIGTAGFGLELLNNLLGGAGTLVGARQATGTPAANQVTDAAAVAAMAALAASGKGSGGTCNEDHTVTRYDAAQTAKIAELETEIKLRDANIYTDSKIADVYERLNTKFETRTRDIEQQLCDQKVYNATNTAVIGCIQGQVAQLQSLTKLVVPNSSVCPGWGRVTIAPESASTSST